MMENEKIDLRWGLFWARCGISLIALFGALCGEILLGVRHAELQGDVVPQSALTEQVSSIGTFWLGCLIIALLVITHIPFLLGLHYRKTEMRTDEFQRRIWISAWAWAGLFTVILSVFLYLYGHLWPDVTPVHSKPSSAHEPGFTPLILPAIVNFAQALMSQLLHHQVARRELNPNTKYL